MKFPLLITIFLLASFSGHAQRLVKGVGTYAVDANEAKKHALIDAIKKCASEAQRISDFSIHQSGFSCYGCQGMQYFKATAMFQCIDG